jgi:hypothetical protein
MTSYSEDPKWADITPIEQDDGGPHPLAAIAYSDEYSEAMNYLRAVMAKNEHSQRVLELTDHIIRLNPAHYTVWYDNQISWMPDLSAASSLARLSKEMLILYFTGSIGPKPSPRLTPTSRKKSNGSIAPRSNT